MSFAKGPRFEPQKVSDVPGPNSYDLTQGTLLDAYKRGAFLEKADRFPKDIVSEVPEPGTYSTIDSKAPQISVDRYAILQRKVEDLERIHNEGKKAHQAEVERLKLELARSQKAAAGHAEHLEKQKKQTALLDLRVQELRKAALAEQAEVKELRVKLRASEHERAHLSSKQGEADELKKALQSLDLKRRDEAKEKDRLIADLEKSEAAEKKKRELAEAKLQQSQSLKAQLAQSQEEARQAVETLASTEAEATENQQSLLDQLDQHRLLLARVAEEYSRLAQETVLASVHAKLKHEHGLSLMRTWRLERKLANSDGQIAELVNLIRHAHAMNAVLTRQIQNCQEECEFYAQTLPRESHDIPQLTPLYDDLCTAMHESHDINRSLHQTDRSLAELYQLTCHDLADDYCDINSELDQERLVSQDVRLRRDALESELGNLRQERETHSSQLSVATQRLDEMAASLAQAEQHNCEYEQKITAVMQQSEMAATNNRKALQQLTETIKRNRMTEDGLRAEIEALTTELADSEQFQAAYYSLSDEVNSLIARNELAEGEAQHLSKFNAEILGHHNPAQRIMYVDRIRRELAELKHKYTITTVELESSTARNAELLRELDMYKSASVPLESKPRTVITRVPRPPLTVLNKSTGSPAVGEALEEFSYAI